LTPRPAVEIVAASPAHVGTIAARMRAADVAECRAFGHSPRQALRSGLMGSTISLTAKVEGRPEAMIGLAPVSLIEGKGTPWMLGTDAIHRQARALLTIGPAIIARFLDSSPSLANLVSARNDRALRLLKALGFEIGDEVEMIGGIPFLGFAMERL
jgi:hypothetical protein